LDVCGRFRSKGDASVWSPQTGRACVNVVVVWATLTAALTEHLKRLRPVLERDADTITNRLQRNDVCFCWRNYVSLECRESGFFENLEHVEDRAFPVAILPIPDRRPVVQNDVTVPAT